MQEPHEYSDTLRALGRFLESVGASKIAVSDEGTHLAVSWQGRSNARIDRQYGAVDIQTLQASARLFRGLEGGNPRFTQQEMLRTLGRQLDDLGAEHVRLVETKEGFWVSARVEGQDFRSLYTFGDLLTRAHEFHRARAPDAVTPTKSPAHKTRVGGVKVPPTAGAHSRR